VNLDAYPVVLAVSRWDDSDTDELSINEEEEDLSVD